MALEKIEIGSSQLLAARGRSLAIITLIRLRARNVLSTDLKPALRSMIRKFHSDPEVGR